MLFALRSRAKWKWKKNFDCLVDWPAVEPVWWIGVGQP